MRCCCLSLSFLATQSQSHMSLKSIRNEGSGSQLPMRPVIPSCNMLGLQLWECLALYEEALSLFFFFFLLIIIIIIIMDISSTVSSPGALWTWFPRVLK